MAKSKEVNLEAINEDEGPVVLKLTIPQELYNEYKQVADSQELSVSELMLHRLQRCAGHSSIRSLYFHTSHLVQLENLLQKRPLETPDQAVALLASALSIRLGDFPPVPVTAAQAKRLKMGAYGGKTEYEHVAQIISAAVAKATGV